MPHSRDGMELMCIGLWPFDGDLNGISAHRDKREVYSYMAGQLGESESSKNIPPLSKLTRTFSTQFLRSCR